MSVSERRVPHVGTYTRSLPVSLERLYENALDWEHLPWLHRSTFCSIELHDSGDWGWRAEVGLQPHEKGHAVVLELRLDPPRRRWITRTLAGHAADTEIWTHAFPIEERRTDIVVDFFVPGVARDSAESVGEFYQTLYARLYDEDASMMAERQRQLDRVKRKPSRERQTVQLGRLEDLRKRLPLSLDLDGDAFRIDEIDGEVVVYSLVCPHLLGPLDQAQIRDGAIECPWHGYRFDVRSRRNIRGAKSCRLGDAPKLSIDPETREAILVR